MTKPPKNRTGLDDAALARIAEQVSLLMQLDRMHGHVSSQIDPQALANVPDHLARIFETAGAANAPISNEDLYGIVNARIARLESALYLTRVELENRSANDPAEIFTDPMLASAYGARVANLTAQPRRFDFGPELMAHGWHPMERNDTGHHRWMRPGDTPAMVCLPHLGSLNQTIQIAGHVLHPDQIKSLRISSGSENARITPARDNPEHYTAELTLSEDDLALSNYVAIQFEMTDFRQPNETDTRLLGTNVRSFTCQPDTARSKGK
jgi:hypothetical protein